MGQDEAFDSLVKEVFDTTMRIWPIAATYLGVHDYDHLLPNVSRGQMLKNIELLEGWLNRLKGIDKSKLTGERRYDYEIAEMSFQMNVFQLRVLRFWERDPDYVHLIGGALYPLFTRTFAPLDVRTRNIASRLRLSGEMLEQAKTCVIEPVKLWTEIALETCQRTQPFIQLIVSSITPQVDESLSKELKEASEMAIEAVRRYEEWLKDDVLPKAEASYVIDVDKYGKLLELKRLGMTVEHVLSIGEMYLQDCRKRLTEIANRIKPKASLEEVKELVKGRHPKTFEEAFQRYREFVERAKKFVIEKGIATIPPDEELKVVETPVFIRHLIPFAAYMPPAPFDKDQTGEYMVTPIEDKPELLREHNYASIINTTVHEGYPGHHLQAVCYNKNPSLIRKLCEAAETVEGYAHWAEEYVRELGFEDTAEVEFIRVTDMAWRAVRVIVDVKLCTGQMSFEEAVEVLVRETGMERPAAVAEVKRYTKSPTYQLSYLIGKHLIQQSREEVKRKLGDKYSDRFFIDTILYSGPVPYAVLREIFEERVNELLKGGS